MQLHQCQQKYADYRALGESVVGGSHFFLIDWYTFLIENDRLFLSFVSFNVLELLWENSENNRRQHQFLKTSGYTSNQNGSLEYFAPSIVVNKLFMCSLATRVFIDLLAHLSSNLLVLYFLEVRGPLL